MSEKHNIFPKKGGENIDSGDKNIDINNSRILDNFGSLIGKTFQKGEIISLVYNNPDGVNIDYKFDISNNKVLLNNKIYLIKPLEGVQIDKIEFTDKNIIIYGLIGIIDGKMEATYEDTLISIDKLYNYIKNNK